MKNTDENVVEVRSTPTVKQAEENHANGLPPKLKRKPRKRRSTIASLDCETGVLYLTVVTRSGEVVRSPISAKYVQAILMFIWTPYKQKGQQDYRYLMSSIRMYDGKLRSISLHRFVYLMENEGFPADGLVVDHKNRVPLDNRAENLRALPPQLNAFNSDRVLNGSSKFPCVSWHEVSQRWRAVMTIEGKQTVLGHFHSPQGAARVVLAKLISMYPDADWEGLAPEFYDVPKPMKETSDGSVPSCPSVAKE